MQNTNPYYRSGYVIVHRPELQLTEGRLDDPVFKALRVGMQPRTPVATLVARYGLLDRARRDRKSTRLNSSHYCASRLPSSALKKKLLYKHNVAHAIISCQKHRYL